MVPLDDPSLPMVSKFETEKKIRTQQQPQIKNESIRKELVQLATRKNGIQN